MAAQPVIEWTIKFGDILVVGSFCISGLVFAFRTGQFTRGLSDMKEKLEGMEKNQGDIREILTELAVQEERMENLTKRVDLTQMQIEELRHGRGFIVRGQMFGSADR